MNGERQDQEYRGVSDRREAECRKMAPRHAVLLTLDRDGRLGSAPILLPFLRYQVCQDLPARLAGASGNFI
jgi:hypothetical protein